MHIVVPARPVPDTTGSERLWPCGHDMIEASLPALAAVTRMVGEPRYASPKGIMGARSKEITTVGLDELGLHGATLGGVTATTRVLDARAPAARVATHAVPAPATEAAREILESRAERRLI